MTDFDFSINQKGKNFQAQSMRERETVSESLGHRGWRVDRRADRNPIISVVLKFKFYS